MLLLKNYHHFKKTSITTLNINKKIYIRVEDLILMLRTKRDNRLSKRRISTSSMALEKIWLKKWQSLKKKTKRKGLL
jgi:hypothetical protein